MPDDLTNLKPVQLAREVVIPRADGTVEVVEAISNRPVEDILPGVAVAPTAEVPADLRATGPVGGISNAADLAAATEVTLVEDAR